jgi:hypothetical protein
MGEFWALLAVAAFFAAIMRALVWLGSRVRSRGGGGSEAFMGPFEEIWHPAAHRARFETLVVEERVNPMPTPSVALLRRSPRRPGRWWDAVSARRSSERSLAILPPRTPSRRPDGPQETFVRVKDTTGVALPEDDLFAGPR